MTRPMMKPGFAVEQAVAAGRACESGEDARGKFHHYAAACPLCHVGGLKVYSEDAAVVCGGCGSEDADAMLTKLGGGVVPATSGDRALADLDSGSGLVT